eukprot:TRINITY_DN8341_c0_g1_i1.p1 TRINITY_DN8341_c0_g1~~TRINITY_DN8341_c0_g1_i1.p1  ORF type:complete len:338 (+),score=105.25 TRINITY_DN8341_c0_g1_i1:39-1052(+)
MADKVYKLVSSDQSYAIGEFHDMGQEIDLNAWPLPITGKRMGEDPYGEKTNEELAPRQIKARKRRNLKRPIRFVDASERECEGRINDIRSKYVVLAPLPDGESFQVIHLKNWYTFKPVKKRRINYSAEDAEKMMKGKLKPQNTLASKMNSFRAKKEQAFSGTDQETVLRKGETMDFDNRFDDDDEQETTTSTMLESQKLSVDAENLKKLVRQHDETMNEEEEYEDEYGLKIKKGKKGKETTPARPYITGRREGNVPVIDRIQIDEDTILSAKQLKGDLINELTLRGKASLKDLMRKFKSVVGVAEGKKLLVQAIKEVCNGHKDFDGKTYFTLKDAYA